MMIPDSGLLFWATLYTNIGPMHIDMYLRVKCSAIENQL